MNESGRRVRMPRLAAIALLAATMFLSSCFTIVKFTMKPKFLTAPGAQGQIFIDMIPFPTGVPDPPYHGYPFVLVGVPSTLNHVGTGKFDARGNYGGKQDSVFDQNLRLAALSSSFDSGCWKYGVYPGLPAGEYALSWEAWRSAGEVNPVGATATDPYRVKVIVSRAAGTAEGEDANFVVVSGYWVDVNDDQFPDLGEVWCTSAIWGVYPFMD